MTPKQLTNKIIEQKLDWVLQEMPSRVIPIFKNDKGQSRINFSHDELFPVKAQIIEKLKSLGYDVIEGEDVVMIEFLLG